MSISDTLLNRRTLLAAAVVVAVGGGVTLHNLPQGSKVIQSPITPEFTPELEEIVNFTEAYEGGAVLWQNGLWHAYGGRKWPGRSLNDLLNTHEIYDPTKTAPILIEMPMAVTDMAAFSLNDKLFSVGGSREFPNGDYHGAIDDVISFSQKNGWREDHEPFPHAIHDAKAAVVDKAAFIFCGWVRRNGYYEHGIYKSNEQGGWDVDYEKISKPVAPITTAVSGKKIYALGHLERAAEEDYNKWFLQIYDTKKRKVELKKAPKEFGSYYHDHGTMCAHLFVQYDHLRFIGWNSWSVPDRNASVFTYLPEENDWRKDFELIVSHDLSYYPISTVHDNHVYFAGVPHFTIPSHNTPAYRFELPRTGKKHFDIAFSSFDSNSSTKCLQEPE